MKKVNVLIVDDSPFQRAILRETLTDGGFNVVGEAKSLKEVISEINKVKPDVVTMDITMPGADGFECAREIHKIDRNIKVILVSAMKDEELIRKAKKANISGYTQKPIDSDELCLLINRVINDEKLYYELNNVYSDVFKESVLNIFHKLTKTKPEVSDEYFLNDEINSEGIAIVMGIIGKYSGRVIFDISYKTAENLAKVILDRDAENKEELLKIAAEITNMFAGNACSMINNRNEIFGLRVAPPTIFHGNEIRIGKADLDDNYCVKINSQYGELSINIGFKRGENEWMSII